MDVYNAAVTTIQIIYNTTVIIRGIVFEIKNYESSSQEVQAKLEHEFLFLEDFKGIMFDRADAALTYAALSDIHRKDIQNSLVALSKVLSQYSLLAIKHGLNLVDAQTTMDAINETISIQDIKNYSSTWQTRFQKTRTRFTKLEWVLFDRDTVLKLLRDYSEWTQRLRQVMMMILLVKGALGRTTRQELVDRRAGQSLGLQQIAERQARAHAQVTMHAKPLSPQSLRKAQGDSQTILYKIAEWRDPAGFGNIPVLLERHPLNVNLAIPTDDAETQRNAILEPVRSLASLLHDPASTNNTNGPDPLQTLQCVGYLDQGYPDYALLVYKYPEIDTSRPVHSLHDRISQFDADSSTKPAIEERFYLAHSIASSIIGVHISGWVHKGLRSQGILLLSDTSCSGRSVPHLIGWGTARRTGGAAHTGLLNADPELGDLEANVYRHTERYDVPQKKFTPLHDLYAFGVVLLEIGCWKTMSARLEGPIRIAWEKHKLPPFSLVHHNLLTAARSMQLKQEMGSEYARAAERCLLSEFEVEGDQDDDKYTMLIHNFQNLVVDKLRPGLLL